jgi:hypothetical protein
MKWIMLSLVQCGLLVGCCTDVLINGVELEVVEEGSGEPICDAVVTASRDGEDTPLSATVCAYVGLSDSPGSYTVTVEHPGHETKAIEITVHEEGCHVATARATVTLRPLSL